MKLIGCWPEEPQARDKRLQTGFEPWSRETTDPEEGPRALSHPGDLISPRYPEGAYLAIPSSELTYLWLFILSTCHRQVPRLPAHYRTMVSMGGHRRRS